MIVLAPGYILLIGFEVCLWCVFAAMKNFACIVFVGVSCHVVVFKDVCLERIFIVGLATSVFNFILMTESFFKFYHFGFEFL